MRATLKFLRTMATAPQGDISGLGQANLHIEEHAVDIADADSADPVPTLATHGFTTIPFSADPPQGEVDDAFRQVFAKRCAAAIKAEVGAAFVIGLSRSVQLRRSNGQSAEAPISVNHVDFTPTSATKRSAEIFKSIGAKRPFGRYATFNCWWLARPGPQDRPLALCDATSLAPPDIQVGRAMVFVPGAGPRDYGEIAFQRYSARHRWYFYPRLGPDRLLLFCGFDSDSSRPSMVTHSAFTNPECPPGAPPRVSIECRCFGFW